MKVSMYTTTSLYLCDSMGRQILKQKHPSTLKEALTISILPDEGQNEIIAVQYLLAIHQPLIVFRIGQRQLITAMALTGLKGYYFLLHAVDPFIGVDDPGNCLCGPYLPFSLIRLGPDTLVPQPTNGYRSNRPIIRFSHTHVSGTGGGGRYGNIGITPFIGLPRFALDGYERANET